jgi:hypothetical protein
MYVRPRKPINIDVLSCWRDIRGCRDISQGNSCCAVVNVGCSENLRCIRNDQ